MLLCDSRCHQGLYLIASSTPTPCEYVCCPDDKSTASPLPKENCTGFSVCCRRRSHLSSSGLCFTFNYKTSLRNVTSSPKLEKM